MPRNSDNPGNSNTALAVRALKRFVTARGLAQRIGVSKIHAYRLLRKLSATYGLEVKSVRECSTGPKSLAYRIFKVS